MVFENLLEFGVLGIFASYLIYDKHFWGKRLINAIDKLTDKIIECPARIRR